MTAYGEIGSYLGYGLTGVAVARTVLIGVDFTSVAAWALESIPVWNSVVRSFDLAVQVLGSRIIPGVLAGICGVSALPVRQIRDARRSELSSYSLLAVWAFDYANNTRERLPLPDTTGRIRGHVEVEGQRQAGVVVHLYFNPNGKEIATVKSGPNGEYEFLGLEIGKPYYTVEGHLVNYNNVVADGVSPKPIT